MGEKLSCELCSHFSILASEQSLCCVGLSFGFIITYLNPNGKWKPSLLRQRALAKLGPEQGPWTDLVTVYKGTVVSAWGGRWRAHLQPQHCCGQRGPLGLDCALVPTP